MQHAAHALLASAGFGRQAGWKIGTTGRVWHGKHEFTGRQPRRLSAECEIAVRTGRDLPRRGSADREADVAIAVAACMVGDGAQNWLICAARTSQCLLSRYAKNRRSACLGMGFASLSVINPASAALLLRGSLRLPCLRKACPVPCGI